MTVNMSNSSGVFCLFGFSLHVARRVGVFLASMIVQVYLLIIPYFCCIM